MIGAMFLFLQSEGVQLGFQIGGGALLLGNTALLLRLSFGAGRAVQKLDDIEHRVAHLEGAQCPHDTCPVKAHYGVEDKK